ncbi:MAG: 50S ribosomal protein L21 [Clostridia bacterium]
MFAIVQCGGKQYKVTEGMFIDVEKLEKNIGDKLNLDVLLVSDDKKTVAGNPFVENAKVEAEVLAHGKGEKIVIFKYKPKKHVRRKQGHRQPFTRVKILSIKA